MISKYCEHIISEDITIEGQEWSNDAMHRELNIYFKG
jgi:hypothetical protein